MGGTSALEGVWESVFSEGVNAPTHRVMNMAFYGLFFTLMALAIGSGGNIHVLALLGLSVCLFLSVNWFIAELQRESAAHDLASKTSKGE